MRTKYFSYVLHGVTIFFVLCSVFTTNSVTYAQPSTAWSDPINLSNSGSSALPSLIVDSKGTIHVIWIDLIDGYKYVKSTDGGKTWTSPKTVVFPFSPKDVTVSTAPPFFIAGKNGEIYIFWQDNLNTLFYSSALSSSFDQPSTWSPIKKIADSVISFDAVVSDKDILHLSYINSLGSVTAPSGVYYLHLGSSGWSTTSNLYSSKYYRALKPGESNISLAVSDEKDVERVIVAWDDRLQKRVFWVQSPDGGNAWDATMQVGGPDVNAGSEIPYNIKVSAVNNKILLLWQIGIPGNRCVQYSQWSLDNGSHFEDPVKLLSDTVSCPKQSNFIIANKDLTVSLLNIQDEISLIAWNGDRWSKSQPQNELSAFLNPSTFDDIILGCQNVSFYDGTLFVIGCDTGTGGDIWFRSRQLGSVNDWFPPASAWTFPINVANTQQMISSLSAVAGDQNKVYAFWVQTPVLDVNKTGSTIVFAEWDGDKWSKPTNVISGFNGIPTELSSTIDKQGKLLLSWVEGKDGDLYFSWANAERAHFASEWSEPEQLPSPSQLNSSSDILVDDAGRIVIVYTVPVNENRGVYIIQSTDLGQTWSQPIRVFDAVAAGWSEVDQPRISLSAKGTLHLIFTRSSLRDNDQSRGLYYSQSTDGGASWSQPEMASEKPVQWSRIVCSDKQTIHRIWQENNGSTFDILDQVSHDGGATWEKPFKVLSKTNAAAPSELAESADGHLYLAQSFVQGKGLVVEEYEWDGSHWVAQEQKELNLDAGDAQTLIATEITRGGVLNVITSIQYPKTTTNFQNRIVSFSRSLNSSNASNQPTTFLIPTPSLLPTATLVSSAQVTPTGSPLANLGDTSASQKNQVGMILVGVVVLLIVIFARPRKKKSIRE